MDVFYILSYIDRYILTIYGYLLDFFINNNMEQYGYLLDIYVYIILILIF
jgi:hypothetical protein